MSFYWQGSDGSIWELSVCSECNGNKEINCGKCNHGYVGVNVTCNCNPYRALQPFDKNCVSCWGSGIIGRRNTSPPVIETAPWWK